MKVPASALMLLALTCACIPAHAEEPAKTSWISDLQLGDHWYGAEISHDDLVGKVVLFEIWGS